MNLQVGVKVFLRNPDGKILLLKRSEEKYGKTDGSWDIVGGRIEPGVPLLENLKREVREETGLEITTEPRLIAAQDIVPNEEKHVVRLTYVAKTNGEPELDDESTEYQWVSLSDFAGYPDLDAYVLALVRDGAVSENSWTV